MWCVTSRVKLEDEALDFRVSMAEIERLSGCTEWIDLSFVERSRTPEWAIQVGIRCHLAGISTMVPVNFSISWESNAVTSPFITGCTRPIYSPYRR